MIAKKLEAIEYALNEAKKDAEKFANGNKTAGTRVRGFMQTIKNVAQEIRQQVSADKNAE